MRKSRELVYEIKCTEHHFLKDCDNIREVYNNISIVASHKTAICMLPKRYLKRLHRKYLVLMATDRYAIIELDFGSKTK